ncbi:hypothetical protein [Citricoccus muralis]|uniref:Uncharacterized protein n=1 Tax=Citricoccus muralis TaxID=169134 RepID=A0ABY8H6C8_9MICC|nr:hypothetical protein [Citricoccus muralis]WFP16270.1 hypothetical protein P8192_12905 [Citricoccus muralis]
MQLLQEQILHHYNISLTNIERTWVDLATLSHLSLVVAGDFMVTGRVQPLTTINSLSHPLPAEPRIVYDPS